MESIDGALARRLVDVEEECEIEEEVVVELEATEGWSKGGRGGGGAGRVSRRKDS